MVIAFIAMGIGTAEAQNRGTVQVSATVVDTRVGFDGLAAARLAVANFGGAQAKSQDTVATMAQISTAYVRTTSAAGQVSAPSVIVTVNYSKN
jgi:hypothetical protein